MSSIKIVDMAIRSSVAMTINIVNQFRLIDEKMLFISSLEKNVRRSRMVQKMNINILIKIWY